jgi:hypothetical protein
MHAPGFVLWEFGIEQGEQFVIGHVHAPGDHVCHGVSAPLDV